MLSLTVYYLFKPYRVHFSVNSVTPSTWNKNIMMKTGFILGQWLLNFVSWWESHYDIKLQAVVMVLLTNDSFPWANDFRFVHEYFSLLLKILPTTSMQVSK